MRQTIIMLLFLFAVAGQAAAGEVFGTITDGSKPVAAGVKVEISASGVVYATETDKFGSYRLFVKEKGKCVLTLSLSNQKPSAELFSYDKSTRYDWIVETKDGKLSLRRK
jgi:hypothetical protein